MTTKLAGRGVALPLFTAADGDPASPVDGAMWINSDWGSVRWRINGTNQDLIASPTMWNNAATSNAWYKAGQHGAISSGIPAANTLFAYPFWPTRRCTITRLAYEVTVQGVSASGTDVMRFGLYDNFGVLGQEWYKPGARIVDFGTVDLEANAPGVYVFDVANQACNPKLLWFAAVRQTSGTIGTAAQLRLQGGTQFNQGIMAPNGVTTPTIGTSGGANAGFWQRSSSVSGALPTPFSTTSEVSVSAAPLPIILIEVSTV